MSVFCVATPVAAKSDEVLSEDERNIGAVLIPPNGRNPESQALPKGAHCDDLPLPVEVHATFLRFLPLLPALWSRPPHRCAHSLVGKQMAQIQRVGQVQQRHHVFCVRARPTYGPTPYGVGICPESAGDLRPRQARLFLEPLQPQGEIVGEVVGDSLVVIALSRHGAHDPPGAQPATLSNTSAGIALPVGPRPRPLRFRVRLRLPHPSMHPCLLFSLPGMPASRAVPPPATSPASPPGPALPG